MDSPQSAVVSLESEKLQNGEKEKPTSDLLGALEVLIHEAKDIHNICIYQKQDVYAKLCLTSDPETTVSTAIINGGGRNPVFNQTLSLPVRAFDSSLKCEIWMLSRVKNYLEDQLLGFAVVPVPEILLHKKLEKELCLSSTDLFHSPAGFVHLTVEYSGTLPDAIPVITAPASPDSDPGKCHLLPSALDRIEFPDPEVVNETNKMVEEYFAMPCEAVGSDITTSDCNKAEAETETSCVESSEAHNKDAKSEHDENGLESECSESAAGLVAKPVIPEPKIVQQEIVDMYMKSMQQFTESLAKMKLPLDLESGASDTAPESSGNSEAEQKTPASSKSSRVYYGSRAFF